MTGKCRWILRSVAKGKWDVGTECGHEFLLTRSMRLAGKMSERGFACPFCGCAEIHVKGESPAPAQTEGGVS